MAPYEVEPYNPTVKQTETSAKNALMMGVTLSRLALLPELIDGIQDRSLFKTSVIVGAAIVADVGDGVLARRLGVDNNARRIADAVVDRATIFTAFGTLIHQDSEYLAWYIPLAVRGSILATGSNLCFWRRNKLVLGGNFHKLASLSQAALGVSLVAGADPKILIPTAICTYGINGVSGLDYYGAHRAELKQKRAERLEKVKIRKLGGLRSLFNISSHPDEL